MNTPTAMSVPRIAGVPEPARNPLHRMVFWFVRRRLGRTVAPLRGWARSGAVLGTMVVLELGMERARRMPARLRMLAELRVAALVGCRFCLDIGSALGQRAGVTEQQLRELNDYATSGAFAPVEKIVLEYADRMTATPADVDDALVARLRSHFDEPQLVELTAAIAHENMRARMNDALGYGAEGFTRGVCALPAGAGGDAERVGRTSPG